MSVRQYTAQLLSLIILCAFTVAGQADNFTRAKQLYEAGNAAISRKDFPTAIDQYTQAISLNPNIPEFYFNRAVGYRSVRKFDLAIKDFQRIIELNPRLPLETWSQLYSALGTVFQENGNYSESLDSLSKALKLDPNNAQFYTNRGNTYVFLKEYDKALDDFNRSLELSPAALTYYDRARLFDEKRDPQKSIGDYSKAIELSSTFAEAYSNRGMAFQKLANLDAALKDFTAAISLSPNDGVYYFNRANIYVLKEQFAPAIKDYTKCIEVFPQWAKAFSRRAVAYRKLGKNDLASADAQRAGELEKEGFNPENKNEIINP